MENSEKNNAWIRHGGEQVKRDLEESGSYGTLSSGKGKGSVRGRVNKVSVRLTERTPDRNDFGGHFDLLLPLRLSHPLAILPLIAQTARHAVRLRLRLRLLLRCFLFLYASSSIGHRAQARALYGSSGETISFSDCSCIDRIIYYCVWQTCLDLLSLVIDWLLLLLHVRSGWRWRSWYLAEPDLISQLLHDLIVQILTFRRTADMRRRLSFSGDSCADIERAYTLMCAASFCR
ncbi:hypothetical protein SDJN02_11869, partial [Cucurbita argyrosperma subsp. argyrosperma]